jgi:putative flippase GtrA
MTPEFLQHLLARAVVRDFLRFAAVGVVATAVHYAVLIGLTELAGVHPVIGTACGALTGGVVSYTLNRLYTFTARPAYMRGLAKFIIVISIGAALNAGIVAFFMWVGLWYLVAQFIATAIVLIWNFAVSRVVVFREP